METSLTIGPPAELGTAIASGFVPASFGPPSGWPRRGGDVAVSTATSPPSASRRGRPARGPAAGEPSRPVAEHAGGKAIVRHDEPRGLGRILELACADRRQSQVTERTAALPALVAPLGLHAFRLG